MNLVYMKTALFDEEMKSGLMREKYGEIHIETINRDSLLSALNEEFQTNINNRGVMVDYLDLIIWLSEDEGNMKSFQIDVNENYPSHQRVILVNKILTILEKNSNIVKQVRITKKCEIDPSLVEQLLQNIKVGDVFENIIENIPKLCFIDSETYLKHRHIAMMIDEFEEILFNEMLNKKAKVNGRGGILREVKGVWGRYGFFETGVRKNYINLSLIQKMGSKTIKQLSL